MTFWWMARSPPAALSHDLASYVSDAMTRRLAVTCSARKGNVPRALRQASAVSSDLLAKANIFADMIARTEDHRSKSPVPLGSRDKPTRSDPRYRSRRTIFVRSSVTRHDCISLEAMMMMELYRPISTPLMTFFRG